MAIELGMIGLGRMGANMAERLHRGGRRVIGFDPSPQARGAAAERGVSTVATLAELAVALAPPRALWLMVPAGAAVDQTLEALAPMLVAGDAVVDGGNSNYKDSQRRARALGTRGVALIDAGTSGGVWGLTEGYSLMLGGAADAIERLSPIFAALAPAPERGWVRVGDSGAGHFCKMIHNGIEYGLMQAYAEGFAILEHKTEFGFDLAQVAEVWRHGSVVRSWLLDLSAKALAADPKLAGVAPYVADSGEGRWTAFEAIDLNVAAPVITLALLQRLRSRDSEGFSDRLLAALRQQFGGHAVKPG
jgi:6-phosphogluconate dehydrogenase